MHIHMFMSMYIPILARSWLGKPVPFVYIHMYMYMYMYVYMYTVHKYEKVMVGPDEPVIPGKLF